MEDVEELKARLIANERLASLGLLTAGIAHEVKNPLNFITNFSDLSMDLARELQELLPAEGKALSAEARADIEGILEDMVSNLEKVVMHGKRADRIVRGMLDHASGRSVEKQPIEVNPLVDDAVALAYHGLRASDPAMNIAFDKSYDAAVGKMLVAPGELSRAILNLVNNACFATHQKRLATPAGYAPKLRVSTKVQGEVLEIRIADNGPGIPDSIRERLFQPFTTTKSAGQGTGLGLSVTRDVIERVHGGSIAVESSPGVGTEFLLRIPRHT